MAELIKAGDEILLSETHKLIHSIWNKEELPEKSLLLYQFTGKATKLTAIIIVGYQCYQLHTSWHAVA
jgi:hypothetical protein